MPDAVASLYEAARVFTPSAPVSRRDLFSGRFDQIKTVINAISQVGRHVIIYGERGVGKTSLANVIHDFLPSSEGILSVMVNCDRSTTFKTLFQEILSDIKLESTKPGMGFSSENTVITRSLDEFLGKEQITPNELRFLFRSLPHKVIIIIDEFDRIADHETKTMLADTIKNFSDSRVDATFILVGVADSVETLITEHESTERALAQILMPRMSDSELDLVVENGFNKLGMIIDEDAKSRIIQLSQGLPHYTHLLCLHSAQLVIEDERSEVTETDVNAAIKLAIDQTQQSIRDSYDKAATSPRGNLFPQVLLACALAKNDDTGYFIASDVKKAMNTVMKKQYEISAFARHLSEFCAESRGPILRKSGSARRFRYRFINPLMESFVIMKGLTDGLITDTDIN